MSYTINLRKYQKLLKEVNYLRSELEYQKEVLRSAHLDFESYYRQWCHDHDVDLVALNEQYAERVESMIPAPKQQQYNNKDELIPPEKIEIKRKANKFSKIYKRLARELHPDKEEGNSEKFAKISEAYNDGQWSVVLEAASDLDILPDNLEEIFPLMKEEITYLKDEISSNKKTYSWMLFECEEDNNCMAKVVKQFLKHLFNLEI